METRNFIRVALTMGYFFGAVVLMALIGLLCYVVAGITRSPSFWRSPSSWLSSLCGTKWTFRSKNKKREGFC